MERYNRRKRAFYRAAFGLCAGTDYSTIVGAKR